MPHNVLVTDSVEFIRRDPGADAVTDEGDRPGGDVPALADEPDGLAVVDIRTPIGLRRGAPDILGADDRSWHGAPRGDSAGHEVTESIPGHRFECTEGTRTAHTQRGATMTEWWFNHKTGEVEEGPQSLGSDRDGPFTSRADAARAPQIAAERSRKWREEEAEGR